MIVRHIILFLLLIVLPDLWIDYRYLRTRASLSAWHRLLWWVPCAIMLALTCYLASHDSFIPRDRMWLDVYLWLIGLVVVPKAVFSLCTFIGKVLCRRCRCRFPLSECVGSLLALCSAGAFAYGFTDGFNHLEVRHVDLYFDNLPSAFDGYRIVQVSDLHVGTYNDKEMLAKTVDSIQAQKADMVCFVGDLQNVVPDEVMEVSDVLSRLANAYSVLGNHDYADYAFFRDKRQRKRGEKEDGRSVDGCETKEEMVNKMKEIQRYKLGFNLLDNENRCIKRDSSAIYVVGTGNYSKPPKSPDKPSYNYCDLNKAMKGVPADAFVIMLQHNPQAWDDILQPSANTQHPVPHLTLSGHTHGGQVAVGALRPTLLAYPQDNGLYENNGRYLYVTSGVGGVVPVRIGVSPEIVVITLKSKKSKTVK